MRIIPKKSGTGHLAGYCEIFQREYIPTGMMPFFAWARVNSLDFHVFLLRSVCRLSIFGAFFVEPWLQSSLGRQRISLRELISRSEEHTSELQSPYDLVCRLLLEK